MTPPIKSTIKYVDLATPALEKYAALQMETGKTQQEAMEKIMMYIVDFAVNKIPKGNRDKLMALMTKVVQKKRTPESDAIGTRPSLRNPSRMTKKNKFVSRWQYTYAARLIKKMDYKGARNITDPLEFYKLVNTFVNRRVFALNLHRAGLYPAMTRLKSRMRSSGKLPVYKNQPGEFKESIARGVMTMIAQNWASAAENPGVAPPLGIAGLAGNAFDLALPEVEKLMQNWYIGDIRKMATQSGLTVK